MMKWLNQLNTNTKMKTETWIEQLNLIKITKLELKIKLIRLQREKNFNWNQCEK